MPTKESLEQIIDEIFALPDPRIEELRRANIATLVQTTINGDEIVDRLAINATVKPGIMGVLVYVLTNRRIIKFDIDPSEIKSASFPLDTITGLERTLEDSRAGINLSFQNGGSFGVKYSAPNQRISDFFQKVDQARVTKANGGIT